ncbi:MAG: UDP-N-acetylglucosamine--N-acetylmuramyl-(pentapeptide) pyrophosphoryl-undecaprenol N-acetylglucosamine transferase [Spirochaetes bacterium]|nr:UDP-N-acetylglucosamine--N-acetylmuramyl-(pentapeptide) pyrophosphoryl-undecaprenol N-acetylglucosamine transferase [Spirochaetota bacterium]
MNVVLTGGGSGGHAFPAMALAERAMGEGHEVRYFGSEEGIEHRLAIDKGIPFTPIPVGKLRRYWSWRNFIDPLRVVQGIWVSWRKLLKLPKASTVVYSFGGFVGLPVVVAAFLARRKCVLHEQTSRAGLANRLSAPLVKRIFLSFETSRRFYPPRKTTVSGYPLRREFTEGRPTERVLEGRTYGVDGSPLLLVTGGGNGSRILNQWILRSLDRIPAGWRILHLTGRSLFEEHRPFASDRYHPVPALFEGMADFMRLSKALVARGGAGTVSEIAFLKKPAVIVPLAIAQGNEQYHNAKEASMRSPMKILTESEIARADLWETIDVLLRLPIPEPGPSIPQKSPVEILLQEAN